MKCVNCGAEIALTDKVCAYCGSRNLKTADLQADKDRLDACTAKLETVKSRLGDYKTAASDVDEVIMNVIGATYNK